MGNINYELLDTVHKFIHRNPEVHDQANFACDWTELSGIDIADQNAANICGTTMCFAGWTAILSGYYQVRPGSDFASIVVNPANGETDLMSNVAAKELGISGSQVSHLFYDAQSLDEVDGVVEQIHSGSLTPESDYCNCSICSFDD